MGRGTDTGGDNVPNTTVPSLFCMIISNSHVRDYARQKHDLLTAFVCHLFVVQWATFEGHWRTISTQAGLLSKPKSFSTPVLTDVLELNDASFLRGKVCDMSTSSSH